MILEKGAVEFVAVNEMGKCLGGGAGFLFGIRKPGIQDALVAEADARRANTLPSFAFFGRVMEEIEMMIAAHEDHQAGVRFLSPIENLVCVSAGGLPHFAKQTE